MRMRYEREKAPRWGGSEERIGQDIGQDDDAEGLRQDGLHPSRAPGPIGTGACEPS